MAINARRRQWTMAVMDGYAMMHDSMGGWWAGFKCSRGLVVEVMCCRRVPWFGLVSDRMFRRLIMLLCFGSQPFSRPSPAPDAPHSLFSAYRDASNVVVRVLYNSRHIAVGGISVSSVLGQPVGVVSSDLQWEKRGDSFNCTALSSRTECTT